MKTKYSLLAAELRRLCIQLRRSGQMRLPGEAELCSRYGTSRQTVRRALDLLEAEGLVLRMRGSGTYLAGGIPSRSLTVSVVTADADEYLYPRLLRDLRSGFSGSGLETESLVTGNLFSEERRILTGILERPPAAVLLEPVRSALPNPNLDLLRRIAAEGIPLVSLRAALPEMKNTPAVLEDNEGGARLLVRHLLEKGHRQLAGVFRQDEQAGPERCLGFVSEALQSGCPEAERHLFWYTAEDLADFRAGGTEPLLRFLRGRLRPCTAVVCHDDRIAELLIRCLLQAGLRVPGDLAVVSFDNSPLCRLSPVPVTSLSHERGRMGDAAVRTVLELLRGRQPGSELLGWRLRERQSG